MEPGRLLLPGLKAKTVASLAADLIVLMPVQSAGTTNV
jgi:hypothetical protein